MKETLYSDKIITFCYNAITRPCKKFRFNGEEFKENKVLYIRIKKLQFWGATNFILLKEKMCD